jgi:hypothetical protein
VSGRAMRFAARALATVTLLSAGATAAHAQRTLTGALTIGRADHRVDFGYGVEAASGTVLGGAVGATLGATLELDASARGATLRSEAGEDRTMGEIAVRAGVRPLDWAAAFVTGVLRAYELAPATQRWTQLGAGAELRSDFGGGAVRGIVRGTLYPQVAVSGLTSPDLGVAAMVGLSARRGRVTGSLEYTVERYAFPTLADGLQRHEQLTGLTLGIGATW